MLAVETSACEMWKSCANNTIVAIEKNEVSAGGIAPKRVVRIKLPYCFFSFGSRASRKAGRPMLKVDIRETCVGLSGYMNVPMMEKIARRSEKMFL